MKKDLKVLSDIAWVSDLLRRSRVECVDVVKHRTQSTVIISLSRLQIEWAEDRPGRMPTLSSELIFRGALLVNRQPSRYAGSGNRPVLECESVEGGYQCILRVAKDLETVWDMPVIDGTFREG